MRYGLFVTVTYFTAWCALVLGIHSLETKGDIGVSQQSSAPPLYFLATKDGDEFLFQREIDEPDFISASLRFRFGDPLESVAPLVGYQLEAVLVGVELPAVKAATVVAAAAPTTTKLSSGDLFMGEVLPRRLNVVNFASAEDVGGSIRLGDVMTDGAEYTLELSIHGTSSSVEHSRLTFRSREILSFCLNRRNGMLVDADNGDPLEADDNYGVEAKRLSCLQYYGQEILDAYIYHHGFQFPQANGVVVEVGALNGQQHSNSLLFEQHLGWRAVLVEGQRECAAQARSLRPNATVIEMVVSMEEGDVEMLSGENGECINWGSRADSVGWYITREGASDHQTYLQNGVTKHMQRGGPLGPTLRRSMLSHGFEEPLRVDLMTIDIESYEAIALLTMDWSIRVFTFVIEVIANEHRVKDENGTLWNNVELIEKILHDHGYVEVNGLPPPLSAENRMFVNERFRDWREVRYV